MLTQKQIMEIKEHLTKAQNPLFFFDNDTDGLCSFLLLQRYIGRGKGVPIKSFPELTADYFRKVDELKADYIFILDKPVISKEFFKKIEQVNIPVVWIDHHFIDKRDIPKFVDYYNPLFNKSKTNEPVTILCYQISQREEDLWLGVTGSISDKFVPDFYSKFKKDYPDLATKKTGNAFDIFYKSQIGKIARIFGFALKDKTTNVINMLKFLAINRGYKMWYGNNKRQEPLKTPAFWKMCQIRKQSCYGIDEVVVVGGTVVVGKNTSTIAESEISSLQLSVTVTVSVPAVPPAVYKPMLSMVLPILLKTSQL